MDTPLVRSPQTFSLAEGGGAGTPALKEELEELKSETRIYPRIILISTQYRTWDDTCDNHIELIKHVCENKIDDTILGIHFYNCDKTEIPKVFSIFKNKKFSMSQIRLILLFIMQMMYIKVFIIKIFPKI